jgi:beta-glucosidase
VKGIEPRFPFGFGLSYTTFNYSGLNVADPHPTSLWETALTVSYTIQNTGEVDGAEVSQVYIGFPDSAGETAPRHLRGFEKTRISQGATEHVTVPLREKDISIWDVVTQKWTVPKGDFKVYVGASSRDIKLTGSFTVN